MPYKSTEITRALRGIVARVTADVFFQEDLFQEALLQFFSLQQRRPGQSLSWYLQGCKLYLKNVARIGRSIDSRKRNKNAAATAQEDRAGSAEDDQSKDALLELDFDDSLLGQVCVHDTTVCLSKRLPPIERKILVCLTEGFSARETARKLGVSHTAINHHRRKIVSVALKLGIARIEKPGVSRAKVVALSRRTAQRQMAKTPGP